MLINKNNPKQILLSLVKDFSTLQAISFFSKKMHLSRVGIWKILKKLEEEKYIILEPISSGKTSAFMVKLNWDNILTEKALDLYLTEEALQKRRWRIAFRSLEKDVDFLLLYGSILKCEKTANDIDIIGIVSDKKKFRTIDKKIIALQREEMRDIHTINFTPEEFLQEVKKNEAFINALKTGVVLFGQEEYIKFMKKVHGK
jgi:DNA-binding Lrp family transcriptional regulator